MNKKIGYVTFGKDDFGYGMAYVLYKNNILAKRATVKTARHFDIILFSIFWWAHVYRFYDFCVKAGIGNKREKPHIIVGGFNSFNPHVFFPFAHQVVVGDGEEVLMAALKQEGHRSIFTGKEKEVYYNHSDISDNDYMYGHTDISRIEIARGCKYKCPYCQLTYLKPYREVGIDSICRAMDKVKTKRVGLFAPNGMSHENYKDIVNYAKEKNLTNIAADVRYNEIHLFENNNTAKVGVEGLSYRLRKSVTKILPDDKFIEILKERSSKLRERGLTPSIETYFILDLPTENEDDWRAFNDLLQKVNAEKELHDLTWIMTANVFMPGPHTPFEDEVIHIDRDYKNMWKTAISDFHLKEKYNFTVGGRHSVFSPYSRVLSMIATRGGTEAGEIIYNIVSNKRLKNALMGRWRKALIHLTKFLRHYDGIERYIDKPEVRPWKTVKLKEAASRLGT